MNPGRNLSTLSAVLSLVASLGSGTVALAECPSIDFEDLATNTAVTTQYPGVTFSVHPQSCGNTPTLYMRVYTPPNGTSSGVKCIRIDAGCPDFSDDYLRMVFDVARREVAFTLGDWATTYTIRYYSTTSGAGLIGSFTVPIPPAGGGDVGVHRRVTVTSASSNIRRVEVQGATSSFEAIDDLSFASDSTAPIAEITSPVPLACVCNGVRVYGSAYDPDGEIERWQLHRKSLGSTSWVLIASSFMEIVDGLLATWTTSAGDGYCTLRLTVENVCGLQTVWTTDVYMDREFNSLALRSPTDGQVLGGILCADGTAWDHCGGTLAVEYRPAAGGVWQSFDSVSPVGVITDGLGSWDTRAVADGDYVVRLTAKDNCSGASAQATVTVDNTPPTALITSPTPCAAAYGTVTVHGTANDAHLASWVLQYAGGNAHGWVTIGAGAAPVVDGLLANWNTAGLLPCAYVLRLVVTDESTLDCNGALRNQSEYTTALAVVGDSLEQDTDADGMPDVWEKTYEFDPDDPTDADEDADEDGQTNLEEYLAGTDPRDKVSVFRMTEIIGQEAGKTLVTWTTAGSHHYLLQGGGDPVGGIFYKPSPLISVPPGDPSTTSYLDSGGTAAAERYYRVRLVP